MTGRPSSIPAIPLPDPYGTYDPITITSSLLNDPNFDQTLKTQAQQIEDRITNAGLNRIPIDQLRGNIESALRARGVKFENTPNILDTCPSYTYKLKFCMVADYWADRITDHNIWGSVPKEVIAESGVTVGFNIRSFEMLNNIAPSKVIGLAEQVSWKMTLTEPYGLSLIDRIYTVSQNMGVANHLKCKYFIELMFTGYNEDGSIAELNQLHVYRVIIKKMEANATEGGATYNIEGIFDGSAALANQLSMASGQVKIEDVSTMGEFFDKLAIELNSQNKNLLYSTNNPQRIEYVFKMPEAWRSWSLLRDQRQSARSSGFNFDDNNKSTISFSKTSVQEILLAVMSMTQEGIKFVLGQNNTTQNGQTRAQSQGINLVPWITSATEFIAYNALNKTYSLRITYFFSEYPTTQGYSTPEAINHSSQVDVQVRRLQSFIAEGRLRKFYNFIFTGLNTDIIKFDIKLDHYWAALLPLNLGENTVSNFSLPPQVGNQSVAIDINNEYRKARQTRDQEKAKLDDLKNQAKKRNNLTIQDAIKEAEKALQAAEQALDAFRNFDLTSFEIQFPTQSPGQQAEAGIVINNKKLLDNKEISQMALSAAVYDKIRRQSGNKDRYLEDVVPTGIVSSPLPISSYTTNVPLVQNISFGAEARADESISPDGKVKPRSRGLLATTLENVTGGHFVNIDLEIRGDPYWLGIDNVINTGFKMMGQKPPSNIRNVSAAFDQGEHAFVLFFITGDEPNTETGYVEFAKTSWAFSGLYYAVTVTSLFQDGKFTQLIKANKDSAMFSVFNDVVPINQPPPPVTSEEIRKTTQK